MTTELVGERSLRTDERGAILVLGIFMSTCIVGALWYLAGIGDAIIYRERMQEAADAVAFSGAVLNARGMNLIVLLNLIMALILAVRVALKAVAAGLFIVGAILSVIPGLQGAATAAFNLARGTEQLANSLRQPINQTIRALSRTQGLLARIVPPAAIAGSFQVGSRYTPIVRNSAAGSPNLLSNGLPIREDSENKLCDKAGEAIGVILGSIVPIPGVGRGIGGIARGIASTSRSYFCELGGGGSPPDMQGALNGPAEEQCREQRRQLEQQATTARQNYDQACASYNCNGGTPTPAQQAELNGLRAQRDAARQQADRFDMDRCKNQTKQQANNRMNQERGRQSDPPSANGQGLTPKRMAQGWKNGVNDAQVVGVATGDMASLRKGTTGSRIGAWRTPINDEIPSVARFGFAQAEFFYDCRGPWTSDNCNRRNNDGNALWTLRWRARLRRYNEPFTQGPGAETIANFALGGTLFANIGSVRPQDSLTAQNAGLVDDIIGIVTSGKFIVH